MLHSFFLRIGLELVSDLFVVMHSVGRLVVAVMAEWHRKTVLLGGLLIGSSEDVMNLYPPPRVAYKAPLFLAYD